MEMNAAVVRSFDHPPRYERFEVPQADGEHEAPADVLAVGLHPRVRTGAACSLAEVEATWHLKDAPGERTVLLP
jgi:hypothetical protein